MEETTLARAPWKGSADSSSGSQPQAITLAVSVSSPGSTGSLAAMACSGVAWFLPPKGISTEPAPMVASNRSTRPLWEAKRSSWAMPRRFGCSETCPARSQEATSTSACFTAPLVFRNARDRLAISRPFQVMTIRASSVTTATR